MVAHPGEAVRPASLQPLNAPQPVQVSAGPDGAPAAVRLVPVQPGKKGVRSRGRSAVVPATWANVAAVEDIWKVVDEWWRGPEHEVRRTYYSLLLEDGRRLTAFRDAVSGLWMRQAD